ncbi:spore germination protein GerW family protein [Nonomuraea sp. B12E4]|uniref:GerW family sporulation protein n=1 Tax=Nonomuraea sp. B12E4 TaxID=3153564 RepID=UPI00325D365B
MDIMELMERSKDAATVKRVFGEPIQQGDVVVIPVARVSQGGGGGQGQSKGEKNGEGTGSGGGFGLIATPAGVYVLKDGDAHWRPAVDVNRVVLAGQIVAVVLLLTLRTLIKKRHKR